jgi:hypothetical protein
MELYWFVKYSPEILVGILTPEWDREYWSEIDSQKLKWIWLFRKFEAKDCMLLSLHSTTGFLTKFYKNFSLPIANEVILGCDSITSDRCLDLFKSALNLDKEYPFGLKPIEYVPYDSNLKPEFVAELDNKKSHLVPRFSLKFADLVGQSVGFLYFKKLRKSCLSILDDQSTLDIDSPYPKIFLLTDSDKFDLVGIKDRLGVKFSSEIEFITYLDFASFYLIQYDSFAEHLQYVNDLLYTCLSRVEGVVLLGQCATKFKWEIGFCQGADKFVISLMDGIKPNVLSLHNQTIVYSEDELAAVLKDLIGKHKWLYLKAKALIK